MRKKFTIIALALVVLMLVSIAVWLAPVNADVYSQSNVRVMQLTSAEFTGENPILPSNVIGYETDTGKIKMGDGNTAWTGLRYIALPTSGTGLYTSPTVSTTFTIADCGKTVLVGTDALTFTVPGTLGCKMRFVNMGTNAYIIQVKTNGTQAFQGTCISGAPLAAVISASTGSTLTNTKSTAKVGDYVEIYSASTASAVFTGCTGTWTSL